MNKFIPKITLFFTVLLSVQTYSYALNKTTNPPSKVSKSSDNKTLIENNYSEFTDKFILENNNTSLLVEENIEIAKAVFQKIEDTANLTSVLEPTSLTSLPIGIKKTIGTCEYMLGISGAKFTKEYTELTVFVRIIIPQKDSNGKSKELFFGANDIKLSHKGGLVGDTTIGLLGDYPITLNGDNSLLILKGGLDMTSGKIENKTYVTIDCNGFKELGIAADLVFSRNQLEPVDQNDLVIPSPAKVTSSFNVVVTNWNDILAEVSLPKFQITSYPGSIFELEKAVIDFSDIRNSEDIVWPKDYKEKYLVEGNENLWRGVYVSNLSIVLPEEIKIKNSADRIKVSAKNLLIDRVGVSGNFSAENIFSIDEGSASGWQYSLDSIYLNFVANDLTGGGFGGKIILPITNETAKQKNLEEEKEKLEKAKADNTTVAELTEEEKSENAKEETTTRLNYVAIINPLDNEYSLNVTLDNDISFDVFKAKASLEKNSYVEMKVEDHKFLPKAMLSGSLSISGSNKSTTTEEESTDPNKKETVDFKGIVFQELQLQTVQPYIQAVYFGYKGELALANFPVSLSNIELQTTETTASLKFDLAVNLMENQFNGETSLKVVGGFDADEGIQKWKYDHIDVSTISLKADIGGAKFDGYIDLRNDDPVYGDGFAGNLKAEFKGGIIVEANAVFGKVDDFRYWYVDAMADGLNVPCGAFVFKGFGGGAFYRMKKSGFSSSFTASGSVYVPDTDSGLGIKAMIHYANAAKPDAFWGGAGFEIAFNKNGGMNRISIYGEGHVMQDFGFAKDAASSLKGGLKDICENEDLISKEDLDLLKESNLSEAAKEVYPDNVSGQEGLNAFAAIEYDFMSETLHGTFDLYINMAGGVFKGIGTGNRAGWAVLHFAPSTWYIRMGTPTDRLGIKMGIGPVAVEAGGYFMIGDDIPASPQPPTIVSQILGVSAESLDYMRNENASNLSSGRGFAFGSDFSFTTGDMSYLIFYANFNAGFGFDIMVKDYGEAQCKDIGQIGINGWYANGQAYAYLQGVLGVKVSLFGKTKKIEIIKGGAAVIVQAKLPNPVWIKGMMGGNYSLLGGLVKGKFKFQLEFGEQCEFINGGPLDDIKAIAEITPNDKAEKVDVFSVPQVAFNMAIDKSFAIEDEGKTKYYKIKLEEYSIKKEGIEIPHTNEYTDENQVLTYKQIDVLPPNSTFNLTIKVSFQEYVNGAWKTILDDNNELALETKETTFTTGPAPDYIPEYNISYCYPVIDQKYFYPKEYKDSYVVLKMGQPYLFELTSGKTQKAIFKTDTSEQYSTISYDVAKKTVTIPIPAIATKKTYNLTLKTIDESTGSSDSNLTESYQTVDVGNADIETEIKSNNLKETITSGDGVIMLTYNFNTSEYNTFNDKMVAKRPIQTLTEILYIDVHALQALHNSTEPFDEVELIGSSKTLFSPLISVEAVLDDTYYLNGIYPLIYAGYLLEPEFSFDREVSVLGVPPSKGVEILSWYEDYLTNSPNSALLRNYLPYRYNLPFYYKLDFIDLRNKIVNKYVNTSNTTMINKYNYIINGTFPYISNGAYHVKFNYILPGGISGNSTGTIFTFNK
jgi:hypothetical protein